MNKTAHKLLWSVRPADRRATIQGSTRMLARALMDPISDGIALGGADVIALAWTDRVARQAGWQTTFFGRAVWIFVRQFFLVLSLAWRVDDLLATTVLGPLLVGSSSSLDSGCDSLRSMLCMPGCSLGPTPVSKRVEWHTGHEFSLFLASFCLDMSFFVCAKKP